MLCVKAWIQYDSIVYLHCLVLGDGQQSIQFGIYPSTIFGLPWHGMLDNIPYTWIRFSTQKFVPCLSKQKQSPDSLDYNNLRLFVVSDSSFFCEFYINEFKTIFSSNRPSTWVNYSDLTSRHQRNDRNWLRWPETWQGGESIVSLVKYTYTYIHTYIYIYICLYSTHIFIHLYIFSYIYI